MVEERLDETAERETARNRPRTPIGWLLFVLAALGWLVFLPGVILLVSLVVPFFVEARDEWLQDLHRIAGGKGGTLVAGMFMTLGGIALLGWCSASKRRIESTED